MENLQINIMSNVFAEHWSKKIIIKPKKILANLSPLSPFLYLRKNNLLEAADGEHSWNLHVIN
jgi:hypothetical protein